MTAEQNGTYLRLRLGTASPSIGPQTRRFGGRSFAEPRPKHALSKRHSLLSKAGTRGWNTTKSAKGTKVGTEIIFKEESYRIMGACFEVYKEKGNGFLEAVYQECLSMEFARQGISFVEKPRLQLDYKGQELRQTYEPDFICFDEIIVEIKALKSLADEHRAQIINYLKATGKQLGVLVNFGHHPRLEYERFVNQPFSRFSRCS